MSHSAAKAMTWRAAAVRKRAILDKDELVLPIVTDINHVGER